MIMLNRRVRLNRILSFLVFVSLSCSIVLIIWNSSLVEPDIQLPSRKRQNKDVIRPNRMLNFGHTDNTQALLPSVTIKRDEQIKFLQMEVMYLQQQVDELKKRKTTSQYMDRNIPNCQVIHIAIVCAGYSEVRRVVTLIKSILFHRQHPLHFHFISDETSQYVLEVLFRTWQLQKVGISFYDAEKLKTEVEWIPNKHYSGVYGLMKLTLTQALPSVLNQVIVLDTDVFFLTDVAQLWSLFDRFTQEQAIGLVENQSEWYTGKLWKEYLHWPALGRGFNTGVMLLHLKRLREIQWPTLWRLTAEKQLLNLLSTVLADQDVINAAIKDNPKLVYTLPCYWNIQLSDNSQSETCYKEISNLKVVHWNSPKKQSVNHKHGEYFRNMYLSIVRYDGNSLKTNVFGCHIASEDMITSKDNLATQDQCFEFRLERKLTRRSHLYYLDYDYVAESHDVTLSTHLSMDRAQILDTLAKHWQGPMSIALYVTDAELQQFSRFVEKSALNLRRNIGLHVVYKDGDFYPVNHLRNVALNQVNTEHVFLSDIDFLPDVHLHEYLSGLVKSSNLKKKVVIVPAFETHQYKFEFPETKYNLLNMLDSGEVQTFRSDVWPLGHLPTDFDKWRKATKIYEVQWQPDFEPYVLAATKDLPLYDNRFVGFGWNKVSHIMELYAAGYRFFVATETFVIHMSHSPSLDISKYRTDALYRDCLRLLKEEFQQDLKHRYGIDFTDVVRANERKFIV